MTEIVNVKCNNCGVEQIRKITKGCAFSVFVCYSCKEPIVFGK